MIVENISREKIFRCSSSVNPRTENRSWKVIGETADGEYVSISLKSNPDTRFFVRSSDYRAKVPAPVWPMYSDDPYHSRRYAKRRIQDALLILYRTFGVQTFRFDEVEASAQGYISGMVSKQFVIRIGEEMEHTGKNWLTRAVFQVSGTGVAYLTRMGCI